MWFVRNGTRVTGPFAESELRSMRQRGEFSPIHHVSTDKIRWESAASLVKMLDGGPQSQQTVRSSDTQTYPSGPSGFPSGSHQTRANWWYLDNNRQQAGPVPEETLRELLASSRVSRHTMVCREGDTAWESARDRQEFVGVIPPTGSRGILVAGFVLIAATLVGGGAVVFNTYSPSKESETKIEESGEGEGHEDERKRPDEPASPETPPKSPSGQGDANLVINSLDNEEQLDDAVALVVMCRRHFVPQNRVYKKGATIEDVSGTGSCFAVTPDGYLLTNKHVVESKEALHRTSVGEGDNKIEIEIEETPLVFFKTLRFDAKIVHISDRFDLAILKIDRRKPHSYFALSTKQRFRQNQEVTALGYGKMNRWASSEQEAFLAKRIEKEQNRVREEGGTLSAQMHFVDSAFEHSSSRNFISQMSKSPDGLTTIVHHAKIFGGNSGGPLVAVDGTVIGINTEKIQDIKTAEVPQEGDKEKTRLDAIGGDQIYIAYIMAQFRAEIDEYIPSKVIWRD